MKKVTLSFPTHESLWTFQDKSKAINVVVTPRKNTVSGLFSSEEIDIAINQFQAVHMIDPDHNVCSEVNIAKTKARIPGSNFHASLRHLFSMINSIYIL